MVSVAHLINILCALIAFSQANDLIDSKRSQPLSQKWLTVSYSPINPFYIPLKTLVNLNGYTWLSPFWNNYAAVGCAYFPGAFTGSYFAKAINDNSNYHSANRRAISLDANQLVRHQPEEKFTCINSKGITTTFMRGDCEKAADILAKEKSSSANFNSCNLKLVNPQNKVVSKQISAKVLRDVTLNILKTCSHSSMVKQSETTAIPHFNPENDVALVVSAS